MCTWCLILSRLLTSLCLYLLRPPLSQGLRHQHSRSSSTEFLHLQTNRETKPRKKKSLKNFPGPVPLVVVGRAGGVTPDLVWDDATLAPSHITAGPGERLTHCFIFFKCHQYRLSSLRVGCRIKDDHHHHFENLPTVTKSFSSVYLVQVQDIILVLLKQIVIFRMPSVLISSSWRNPVIGRLEVIKMSPDQK